jgi:hypothetical protein
MSNQVTAPSGNIARRQRVRPWRDLSVVSGYGSNDHNLNSGQSGVGNINGTPVFVGGSNPTSYDGYRLASGSPGKVPPPTGQTWGSTSS